MNTYIVMRDIKQPLPKTNEEAKVVHEEQLFLPLEALASSSGQFTIVNKMKLIGVAVIESTDEGVKLLKEAGYSVHANETKYAT